MKRILGILIMCLMFVVSIDAQVIRYDNAEDTITTSTSVDTVTFTFQSFNSPMNYELQVNSDNLSGTTNANCYLELNQDRNGTDWTILKTTALSDGKRGFETGSFLYGTLRCKCIAPSSTQSTAIRVDLVTTRQ